MSVEKMMICCIYLFLFSLCLSFFHSLFLSLWRLCSLQANEWEKAVTMRISLCWFSPLFLVKTLIWKSCFCCFSHFPFQQFIWDCNQSVLTPISYLSALWPCFFSVWTAHRAVFPQEQNRTQIARGNLKWEALKRRWKKLYLATHSAINPVMVQLPLSKRGLKASRQATTQLSANSLHPFCQQGKNLIRLRCTELHWKDWIETEQGKNWDKHNRMKSEIRIEARSCINTALKYTQSNKSTSPDLTFE